MKELGKVGGECLYSSSSDSANPRRTNLLDPSALTILAITKILSSCCLSSLPLTRMNAVRALKNRLWMFGLSVCTMQSRKSGWLVGLTWLIRVVDVDTGRNQWTDPSTQRYGLLPCARANNVQTTLPALRCSSPESCFYSQCLQVDDYLLKFAIRFARI